MDSFVAEIRIFGFGFVPSGWALCDGQELVIAQNASLWAVIHEIYGGDGVLRFNVPNLQGTVPVHVGGAQPGPGLRPWTLTEQYGASAVTLSAEQMASHGHVVQGKAGASQTNVAAGAVPATGSWVSQSQFGVVQAYTNQIPDLKMRDGALGPTGGGQPHKNMMPGLAMNFCVSLAGMFPPHGQSG